MTDPPNFCKQVYCLSHAEKGYSKHIPDLIVCDTLGTVTGPVQALTITLGGDPPNVITFDVSPVVATLTDSVSYINVLGNTQSISLPNEPIIGFRKIFIMLSDGNVTITPTTGPVVNLKYANQSVTFIWNGVSWYTLSMTSVPY